MPVSVLTISKPVVPPWNDSSKNLVRDLVLGTEDVDFVILTDGSGVFDLPHVTERPVYRGAGRFAPGLRQNAKVVRQVLSKSKGQIQHFFFAPNPRTSSIIRGLRRIRRSPSIHTICSVPESFERIGRALFADVHVAVSRFTEQRLKQFGVERVHYIPPSVPPLQAQLTEIERAAARAQFGLSSHGPVVVYPGDYSFSRAAFTVAASAKLLAGSQHEPTWVFACRIKDSASTAIEAEIRTHLAQLADRGKVLFLNHVERIHDLLAASDIVVLPAESTYAKMDLPLVLLEALAIGRPIVVSDCPPLGELLTGGAGVGVPPNDADALAGAIEGLLDQPGLLEELGKLGASWVNQQFDRTKIAAQYVSLYRELGD